MEAEYILFQEKKKLKVKIKIKNFMHLANPGNITLRKNKKEILIVSFLFQNRDCFSHNWRYVQSKFKGNNSFISHSITYYTFTVLKFVNKYTEAIWILRYLSTQGEWFNKWSKYSSDKPYWYQRLFRVYLSTINTAGITDPRLEGHTSSLV